jgi:hypothetical protein
MKGDFLGISTLSEITFPKTVPIVGEGFDTPGANTKSGRGAKPVLLCPPIGRDFLGISTLPEITFPKTIPIVGESFDTPGGNTKSGRGTRPVLLCPLIEGDFLSKSPITVLGKCFDCPSGNATSTRGTVLKTRTAPCACNWRGPPPGFVINVLPDTKKGLLEKDATLAASFSKLRDLGEGIPVGGGLAVITKLEDLLGVIPIWERPPRGPPSGRGTTLVGAPSTRN